MLLTVRDVARKLNVSPSCVYQLISQGRIPAHRIGVGRGAIRVKPGDLDEYLEHCQSKTITPLNVRFTRKLKHLRL